MNSPIGILFNHESSNRQEPFVTRKISRTVADISLGLQVQGCLGNPDAKRDWGDACDHVKGMWLMMQQEKPDNCIRATDEMHSLRDFI